MYNTILHRVHEAWIRHYMRSERLRWEITMLLTGHVTPCLRGGRSRQSLLLSCTELKRSAGGRKEAQRILTYAPCTLLLWPDRCEVDCSSPCVNQQPYLQNLESRTMVADHSEAQVYTTLHIVDLP